MFQYRPDQIIVDEPVRNSVLTQEILETFQDVPFKVVSDFAWHRDVPERDPSANPLTQGKRILHLKHFQGKSFKECPGVTGSALCCNYFTIDFIENCPLECTYCILQAYLNKPVITVHANLEEILDQVKTELAKAPERFFRVGTGEHSDSLALDPLLGINRHLVPFFGKLDNAVLELKTKSNHIEHLLDLPHNGHTVIAWSLNPEEIVTGEEHKTASLQQRLNAAQRAAEAGYLIAFHLDPMIHYPGWEAGYRDLIERMLATVEPERIAWVSLGSLRGFPKLKSVVEERFPKSRIFLGEFVRGEDGKMRYPKTIRQRMFQHVSTHMRQLAPAVPLYLCMETQPVWGQSMPYQPQSNNELESAVSRVAKTFSTGCPA